MDEYETTLKQNLDMIPEALKREFVPLLKAQFKIFADMGMALESNHALVNDPDFIKRRDDDLASMKRLYDAFHKAGGTGAQWNILAPAVHYGDYDRLQP